MIDPENSILASEYGGHIILLLVAWTLPWKGVALWKAARQGQKVWFVLLLVVNTLALLEILYIFFFSRFQARKKEAQQPKTSVDT